MADDAHPRLAPHRTTRKALRTHPGDRQRVDDRNRVVIDERQKRARRSVGPAPLLFPTLECAESDTEGTCEFALRELRLGTYRRDIEIWEFVNGQAIRLALGVRERLAQAG